MLLVLKNLYWYSFMPYIVFSYFSKDRNDLGYDKKKIVKFSREIKANEKQPSHNTDAVYDIIGWFHSSCLFHGPQNDKRKKNKFLLFLATFLNCNNSFFHSFLVFFIVFFHSLVFLIVFFTVMKKLWKKLKTVKKTMKKTKNCEKNYEKN